MRCSVCERICFSFTGFVMSDWVWDRVDTG